MATGRYTINESQICTLLLNGHLEMRGATLVYREDETRPIVKKEIKPFGDGGHHVLVPATIAESFTDVLLLPVKEKPEGDKKKVFERAVTFTSEDVFVLMVFKGLELTDAGLDLKFKDRLSRPIERKEITRCSARGHHVIVPSLIGLNYSEVFIIPQSRNEERLKDAKEAIALIEQMEKKGELEAGGTAASPP